jgi:lysyl-tRNA synthetase class 2
MGNVNGGFGLVEDCWCFSAITYNGYKKNNICAIVSHMEQTNEYENRLKTLDYIKSKNMIPFAEKYERKHTLVEARELRVGTLTKVAGRVISLRDMGKIAFMHLQDQSGRMQVVFKSDAVGTDKYKEILKIVGIGDFIGVEGEVFVTQRGEVSILANDYTFLSKALRPLPDKWSGLSDIETRYRQRYLDLISNRDAFDRFKFRSDFIWELRKFYNENDFCELDTPVLQNSASGALAKPFSTHYNALDMNVFLRIAPEIFLKEAIIGGFERIFEVARVFRNEGMDSSHLQEFTMIEHYCAYWNFEDNMRFTEKMLTTVVQRLMGTLKFKTYNKQEELIEVDLSTPWRKVSFRDLLLEDCGIDIDLYPTAEELRKIIGDKKIQIDDINKLGRGNMIDSLYKKVSRPKLVNPTFLLKHPLDLSPLARANDDNPLIVDRFQLVINGWEIVNAYSELADPVDQRQRFAKQTEAREIGDEEAMQKDDEFVEAMEYGMPPVSGWGMGVERIVALLTQ